MATRNARGSSVTIAMATLYQEHSSLLQVRLIQPWWKGESADAKSGEVGEGELLSQQLLVHLYVDVVH